MYHKTKYQHYWSLRSKLMSQGYRPDTAIASDIAYIKNFHCAWCLNPYLQVKGMYGHNLHPQDVIDCPDFDYFAIVYCPACLHAVIF